MTTNATDKPANKKASKAKDEGAPDFQAMAQGLIGQLPADALQTFIANSQAIIQEGQARVIVAECEAKLTAINYRCDFNYGPVDGSKPKRAGAGAGVGDGTPGERKRKRTTAPGGSGRGRPALTDADEKYDGARVVRMLKAYKKEHKSTISELATACGVTSATIVHWTSDVNLPTGHNLATVAKLVGL